MLMYQSDYGLVSIMCQYHVYWQELHILVTQWVMCGGNSGKFCKIQKNSRGIAEDLNNGKDNNNNYLNNNYLKGAL